MVPARQPSVFGIGNGSRATTVAFTGAAVDPHLALICTSAEGYLEIVHSAGWNVAGATWDGEQVGTQRCDSLPGVSLMSAHSTYSQTAHSCVLTSESRTRTLIEFAKRNRLNKTPSKTRSDGGTESVRGAR